MYHSLERSTPLIYNDYKSEFICPTYTSVRNRACPRQVIIYSDKSPILQQLSVEQVKSYNQILFVTIQCSHKMPKLEEFISWQRPGSDCHKVTAGFRSQAFEVDTVGATTDDSQDQGCLKILCNYDCLSTRSLTEPGTAL